jgi:hypothetical protein
MAVAIIHSWDGRSRSMPQMTVRQVRESEILAEAYCTEGCE